MNLLKIGQLAQEINRLPSAIHFYTQEGLIKPNSYTQGGYRLYEKKQAIKRIRLIEKLQFQKRWRIEEIKNYLKNK
jgi:DNA-binding transcriptional MerR regulator